MPKACRNEHGGRSHHDTVAPTCGCPERMHLQPNIQLFNTMMIMMMLVTMNIDKMMKIEKNRMLLLTMMLIPGLTLQLSEVLIL